jgi:hypothetical protein
MKQAIKNILNKEKELQNCKDLIFQKENDILSCIKAVGEEGMRSRQKQAAVSLLDLKNKKEVFKGELADLCKSFDATSFANKKLSSSIVAECISEGVCKEDLSALKEAFKSL